MYEFPESEEEMEEPKEEEIEKENATQWLREPKNDIKLSFLLAN